MRDNAFPHGVFRLTSSLGFPAQQAQLHTGELPTEILRCKSGVCGYVDGKFAVLFPDVLLRPSAEGHEMAREIILIWWCLSPLGLVLLATGVILRLCESSWEKPFGSMGSAWLLGIGAVLCLPIALYLIPALLEQLFR